MAKAGWMERTSTVAAEERPRAVGWSGVQYGERHVGVEVELGCLGRRQEVRLLGGGVFSQHQ